MALRYGWIGIGQMGFSMAKNLVSKTKPGAFVVCDPNPESVAAFSEWMHTNSPEWEFKVANTPSEVAENADTIFTMLPSSPQVKRVYLGDHGILQALSSLKESNTPRLFVDSTTLDVSVARDVAKRVTDMGCEAIDAPVSGGVVGAKAGKLSFMVGGPDASFERAQPLLNHMGTRVIHCGASGNGLIAKLCNNHILGINQIAIAEGMLLGTSLGLAPGLLASIINTSTGRSWPSEVNNPVPGALPDKQPPCTDDYNGGFASKLMLKDMLLAQDASTIASLSSSMPLGARAREVYEEMIAADAEYTKRKDVAAQSKESSSSNPPKKGRADKDFSVVYEYLKDLKSV